MKYKSVITGIGPEALEFLSPELDLNFVIIFNEDAPPELAELAILHTNAALEGMPAVGDTFKLGKKTYKIINGICSLLNNLLTVWAINSSKAALLDTPAPPGI